MKRRRVTQGVGIRLRCPRLCKCRSRLASRPRYCSSKRPPTPSLGLVPAMTIPPNPFHVEHGRVTPETKCRVPLALPVPVKIRLTTAGLLKPAATNSHRRPAPAITSPPNPFHVEHGRVAPETKCRVPLALPVPVKIRLTTAGRLRPAATNSHQLPPSPGPSDDQPTQTVSRGTRPSHPRDQLQGATGSASAVQDPAHDSRTAQTSGHQLPPSPRPNDDQPNQTVSRGTRPSHPRDYVQGATGSASAGRDPAYDSRTAQTSGHQLPPSPGPSDDQSTRTVSRGTRTSHPPTAACGFGNASTPKGPWRCFT